MISVLATILFTFNTAHAGDTEEFSALLDRFGIKGAFFREAKINQQIVRKADERQYREFQLKNEKLEGTLVVEEISPVDASFAKKFKTLNYGTILESYQNHRNPYTGHATVTIVCPQEAMPEHAALEFAGSQADAIVANTSRTNAFGVCLPDMVKNKALIFIGHDPTHNRLLHVRFFLPAEKYGKPILNRFLDSLSPKSPVKVP